MSDEIEQPDLPRPRRSTIEAFNDELAVLDRPLENDVEYFDEKPPVAKRRRFGAIAGGVLVLGALASLLLSRGSGEAHATPPLAIASAPVTAAPAPEITPVAAAPTPPAPAPMAMNNEPPAAMPRASSRAAWTKAAAPSRHESRSHRKHRSR